MAAPLLPQALSLPSRRVAERNVRAMCSQPPPRPLPFGWKHPTLPGVPLSCLPLVGHTHVRPPLVVPPAVDELLLPIQRERLQSVLALPGGYLAWRTGAGKSYGAAAWLAAHWAKGCRRGAPPRLLIVTPAGAMPYQLASDLATAWRPLHDMEDADYGPPGITILSGRTPDFEALPKYGVIVCSWSLLVAWYKTLLLWSPHALVVDEAHCGKAWKVWKRVATIDRPQGIWMLAPTRAGALHGLSLTVPHRLLLSATPVPTRRIDAWNQLEALEPGCWGKAREFGVYFCEGREGDFGFEANGKSNSTEFMIRVRTLMSFLTTQDLGIRLPQLRITVECLPREVLCDPRSPVKAKSSKSADVLHARILDAAERKTDWAVDVIRNELPTLQKMALITGRRLHVNTLRTEILKAMPGVPLFIYTGGAKPENLVNYQAAPHGILLGTYQACGIGVNLHTTRKALSLTLPWTPGDLIQLAGRFQRVFGVDCELVLPRAEGTIDDRIRQVLLPRLADVLEMSRDGIVRGMKENLDDKDEVKAASLALLSDDGWE